MRTNYFRGLVALLVLIITILGFSKQCLAKQYSGVTMIGDSVTLGAKPALEKQLPGIKVDAKEGRQVTDAGPIIDQLKTKHQLGHTVVIALGANGPFSKQTGQALINQLGSHRQIYWVNVYGKDIDWADSSNQTIQSLSKKNKNIHLINWQRTAKQHPDWFYDDGIHLQPAGQTGFAHLIKHSIQK